jgi:hypothetical protein
MGDEPQGLKRVLKKDYLELRAKDPGLKPLDSIGLIQGAEAPCSLRKNPCSLRKTKT